MSRLLRLPRRALDGTVAVTADSLRVGVTSIETPLIYYLVGRDTAGRTHRLGAWTAGRNGDRHAEYGWKRHEEAVNALNRVLGITPTHDNEQEGAA